MNETEKEKSLEESFAELDGIIEKMQTKDLPLEETFALYQQGVSLVEQCSQKIQKVECDIKRLTPEE